MDYCVNQPPGNTYNKRECKINLSVVIRQSIQLTVILCDRGLKEISLHTLSSE